MKRVESGTYEAREEKEIEMPNREEAEKALAEMKKLRNETMRLLSMSNPSKNRIDDLLKIQQAIKAIKKIMKEDNTDEAPAMGFRDDHH